MTDNTLNSEENKPSGKRPPKRNEIGGNKVAGSRISYKDRKKLEVAGRDPNFVYRWVNSDDSRYAGRVENFKNMGYTTCSEEELVDSSGLGAGSIGSVVGKPVGRGIRGVLMKIHKDLYEEDQQQKQAEVDDTEKGMMPEELLKHKNSIGDGLKISRPSENVQHKK